MQMNRLFETVHLLMHKKCMTAVELAAHFEVSKRTILRDIDTLATAGIPVYTLQGKGGGIFIEDDFVLDKAVLSAGEQREILFSLQSMAATELIDTNQVLGRLRSFFAGPAKEWVEVDFSRWGHSPADNAKFELLKHAIIHELAVSFDYLSPYGESKGRTVYPLRLSFKSKAWYLQTFCLTEQDYRVFKFARISNIAALDVPFSGGAYDPPSIQSVEETAPADWIDMRVLVLKHAMYRIYDEFVADDITANEDGTFTLRIPRAPWVYDYILSYGIAMEVLEPQCIRDELRARAGAIAEKYLAET